MSNPIDHAARLVAATNTGNSNSSVTNTPFNPIRELPQTLTLSTEIPSRSGGGTAAILTGELDRFHNLWVRSHRQFEVRVQKLSRESRSLLEAQAAAQSLQREGELVGKVAEALSETLRRSQQIATN